MIKIPFNRPGFIGQEIKYIKKAVKSGKISGDGVYSQKCCQILQKKFDIKKAFLTPSATSALEMASILCGLNHNSQVIVPSFTYTSTVNAFALFGAKPIFVDIRPDTLNIDEKLVKHHINKKTKAIYCIHYASVASEMDSLKNICQKHNLFLVEDAAQALSAKYKNQFLGTIGDFGAYSFHETKNYYCGEGGAILVNRKKFIKRAEIIREKGTDRARFFRGEIDKYTWRDVGSSYLLSEILAAYLYAKLNNIEKIWKKRKSVFDYYLNNFKKYEKKGLLTLPVIPKACKSNYHQFHVLFESKKTRDRIMKKLKQKGILAVFHYLPLHLSPMGKKLGNKKGSLPVTEEVSAKLLRFPLYNDITKKDLEYIVKTFKKIV